MTTPLPMEPETIESGNLLHEPSNSTYLSLERLPSAYQPLHSFALPAEKHYQQQYADIWFLRLAMLKKAVEKTALEAWEGFRVGSDEAKRVDRVLDVRQGELCWVIGTVYMEMGLKPNILEDISKDHWISAPPPRQKYVSKTGEDLIMIEDESGRLRLTGPPLQTEFLVTGCVIAVMGTENANGDFEVVDIRLPDLPAQPDRWSISKPSSLRPSEASARKSKRPRLSNEKDSDGDEEMADASSPSVPTKSEKSSSPSPKIAIVSSLGFSGTSAATSMSQTLLLEYLLGTLLSPEPQSFSSHISRLIIAGNSLSDPATDPSASAPPPSNHPAIGTSRKSAQAKKYGYDSSAYNPAPIAHLDTFLAELLPSLPVTIMPGEYDPANASLPQAPLHSALFPKARVWGPDRRPGTGGVSLGVDGTGDGKGEEETPGWLDAVTNPWEGEVEGWRVLGTGGQNLDDVMRYVESEDRVGMMEAMCRWRCVAPTAPDTIWSYPFQSADPYVLTSCPHLFFVGSQPHFDTSLIEGTEGQAVRLIAIPRFSETGEIVLVDGETLEVEVVKIGVLEEVQEVEEVVVEEEGGA